MITGVVDNVIFKGVHYEMIVMQGDMEWMIHSTDMVEEGSDVGMHFDPDEIHIMKKVAQNA